MIQKPFTFLHSHKYKMNNQLHDSRVIHSTNTRTHSHTHSFKFYRQQTKKKCILFTYSIVLSISIIRWFFSFISFLLNFYLPFSVDRKSMHKSKYLQKKVTYQPLVSLEDKSSLCIKRQNEYLY